jgi:ribosomal protein S20
MRKLAKKQTGGNTSKKSTSKPLIKKASGGDSVKASMMLNKLNSAKSKLDNDTKNSIINKNRGFNFQPLKSEPSRIQEIKIEDTPLNFKYQKPGMKKGGSSYKKGGSTKAKKK